MWGEGGWGEGGWVSECCLMLCQHSKCIALTNTRVAYLPKLEIYRGNTALHVSQTGDCQSLLLDEKACAPMLAAVQQS